MPRNGSGTYTLPQPAFVTNTVISSVAVNSDFSDIATALTDSIAVDGQSPITAPIPFNNGALATPGVTFAGDDTTGLYLPSAGSLGIGVSGSVVAVATPSLVTWTPAQTFNGSVTLTGPVTLNATSYTWGPGAANAWWADLHPIVDIAFVIDGGGAVISTGVKGFVRVPFGATIISWGVMGDQSGSITVDILRANNAVPSSSMVGSGNPPALSSGQYNEQLPSGWNSTTLTNNDWLGFDVTGSPSGVTRVTIAIVCQRTSN